MQKEYVDFDKNFIINKNRLRLPASKKGNKCLDFCQSKEAYNRRDIYRAKRGTNICLVLKKIHDKENKDMTEKEKLTSTSTTKKVSEPQQIYTVLEECEYLNINNTDFSNSIIAVWPKLIPVVSTKLLEVIYGIDDFNKYLNFIKNSPCSYHTKLRVTDCIWEVYVNTLYIHDTMVDFFVGLAKTIWISDLYTSFYQYIYVKVQGADTNDTNDDDKDRIDEDEDKDNDKDEDNDKVTSKTDNSRHSNPGGNKILIKKNNQKKEYYKKERINFFAYKFINNSRMYEFLNYYHKYYKKKFESLQNKTTMISPTKKKYFDFIGNKIEDIIM